MFMILWFLIKDLRIVRFCIILSSFSIMSSTKSFHFSCSILILVFLLQTSLVCSQSNTTTTVATTSNGSFLTQICLDLEEYRTAFTSAFGDSMLFGRDTIATFINYVDLGYNVFNHWKWVIDFVLGALTTFSVFLPGGPLIPVIARVVIEIIMNMNMKRIIKMIMYEVWTMMPASGSSKYNVTMENDNVVVRQIAASTVRMFKRATTNYDWAAIFADLGRKLSEFQQQYLAHQLSL